MRALLLGIFGLGLTLTSATPALAARPECESKPKAVLIDCVTDREEEDIFAYLYQVLRQNGEIIIVFATLLVVFSGLQYILASGNTSVQADAKKRIVEIVIGVIFYTLITFTLNILGADTPSAPAEGGSDPPTPVQDAGQAIDSGVNSGSSAVGSDDE